MENYCEIKDPAEYTEKVRRWDNNTMASGNEMGADIEKLLNNIAYVKGLVESLETSVWSLSGGTVIPANSDLNDYKTPGNYSVGTNTNAKTILNRPIDVAFVMKVYYATGTASYPAQEIVAFNTGRRYRRYFTGGDPNNNWTNWLLLDKPSANNLTTTADGYVLDARVGPAITEMIDSKQDLLAKGSQITNIDEFTLGVAWMNFGSSSISGTKPYNSGYGYVLAFQSGGSSYVQIAMPYSGVSPKFRTHVNGEWQSWRYFYEDLQTELTAYTGSTLTIASGVGTVQNSLNFVSKNGCVKSLGLNIQISKTVAQGGQIATIPSGYRPTGSGMCTVVDMTSSNVRMFQATGDGAIKVYGGGLVKDQVYFINMTYI